MAFEIKTTFRVIAFNKDSGEQGVHDFHGDEKHAVARSMFQANVKVGAWTSVRLQCRVIVADEEHGVHDSDFVNIESWDAE